MLLPRATNEQNLRTVCADPNIDVVLDQHAEPFDDEGEMEYLSAGTWWKMTALFATHCDGAGRIGGSADRRQGRWGTCCGIFLERMWSTCEGISGQQTSFGQELCWRAQSQATKRSNDDSECRDVSSSWIVAKSSGSRIWVVFRGLFTLYGLHRS